MRWAPFILFLSLVTLGCDLVGVDNEPVELRDDPVFIEDPAVVEMEAKAAWVDYWRANQYAWSSVGWSTIADELTSTSSGYGRRTNSSEPRQAFDNDPDSNWKDFVLRPWGRAYDCLRAATSVLVSTTGRSGEFEAAGIDLMRAEAFAHFNAGLCLGTIALRFDQGFVLVDGEDVAAFDSSLQALDPVPYDEVMLAAIGHLDEAIDLAHASSFTLEGDWIWGLTLSGPELARIANSFAARFLAGVARTPAEREAVDWLEVRRRIDAGTDTDFSPIGVPETEAGDGSFFVGQNPITSRVDYRTIGPADESGGYASWLAAPLDARAPFELSSSDRRIQGAGGHTEPGSYFRFIDLADSGAFIANRGLYHFSSHTFFRWIEYSESDGAGPMPHLLVSEMDLLAAEALLRLGGSTSEVVELINRTRVGNGQLPPATTADPIGTSTDGSWRHTSIHLPGASMWAKLQHEYRMETFLTTGALAWVTDRGWGDLVEGTPIHYPVPAADLARFGLESYTFGGQ